MNKNFSRVNKRKQNSNFNRLKLLTSKKQGYSGVYLQDNKKIKLSKVPYMNTRSVTKKMYNIGATYHAPNIKDEIQWREWPIHGMHDRPIFHPQIGLATEFFGRKFSSFDDCAYNEISPSIFDIEQNLNYPQLVKRKTYTRKNKNNVETKSMMDDSFENCMHNSFHSVLAYSAQMVTPYYKKIFDDIKKKNSDNIQPSTSSNSTSTKSSECNPNYLQKKNTNNTLNKLKAQQIKPSMSFKCIKNHAKLQQVLERGSKNTLILLKTSDPNLKKENSSDLLSIKTGILKNPTMPVKHLNNTKNNDSIDTKITHSSNKESCTKNTSANPISPKQLNVNNSLNSKFTTNSLNKNCKKKIINDENDINGNWLQELIEDTAILYCIAVGVHQDDLVNYLNNLDSSQCMNWFDL